MIYTDNRATSSTFRDRGTSYAPTYLIYADKQRTADDAKQLIDDLGLAAHLDEYKARAFVVGPSDGTAYGPADLTAFQDLLRTRRSSNLKVIGVGAGATFVNSVIAKYAFAVAGILTYGGTVDKGVTSSIPVPAYVHGSDRAVAQLYIAANGATAKSTTRKRSPPTRIRTRTRDCNASSSASCRMRRRTSRRRSRTRGRPSSAGTTGST